MSDDDRDEPGVSSRRALIGLLAFVLAIVAVLFIVQQLRSAARIQDCVASGRTNCATIDPTTHQVVPGK
jgi:hypothetical protein